MIYKICDADLWRDAEASGRFEGMPVDLADGFIHFSTGAQLRETATKHFAGRDDLILAAFEADVLGDALRWEPSRGGALFPHLYRALDPEEALWTRPLTRTADGSHDFGEGVT